MFQLPFYFKRQWSNKRIALVSILIATSVAFVVIFTRIIPIATIPSFKIAIAGLPIKISGYVFGPFIGAITGVISDLLSFAIFPTIFHFWYTLSFAVAGFIPGLYGYIMHRRWKYKSDKNPADNFKYNDINFLIAIATILITMLLITWFVFSKKINFESSIIKNRWIFFGVVISGSVSMLFVVLGGRIFLKPKLFNSILPIIAFSSALDLINTPLVSLGDQASIIEDNFLNALTGHTILTPIKSWGNLIIIFFSYKVVSPLIFNKTSNDWEGEDFSYIKWKKAKNINLKKGKK